jgi:hypothetical protein
MDSTRRDLLATGIRPRPTGIRPLLFVTPELVI